MFLHRSRRQWLVASTVWRRPGSTICVLSPPQSQMHPRFWNSRAARKPNLCIVPLHGGNTKAFRKEQNSAVIFPIRPEGVFLGQPGSHGATEPRWGEAVAVLGRLGQLLQDDAFKVWSQINSSSKMPGFFGTLLGIQSLGSRLRPTVFLQAFRVIPRQLQLWEPLG